MREKNKKTKSIVFDSDKSCLLYILFSISPYTLILTYSKVLKIF